MKEDFLIKLVKEQQRSKLAMIIYDNGKIARPLYCALIRGGNKYAREMGLRGLLKRIITEAESHVCASQLINDASNFIPHIYN